MQSQQPQVAGRGGPAPMVSPHMAQAPANLAAQRQGMTLQHQQQQQLLQAGRGIPQTQAPGGAHILAATPPIVTAASNIPQTAPVVIPPDKVDFEFLPLIVEILRLLEDGKANTDTVRQKVEYLQAKFTAAKVALEAMDGADLTEELQLETFYIYQQRLQHLNSLMEEYSKLPLLSAGVDSASASK